MSRTKIGATLLMALLALAAVTAGAAPADAATEVGCQGSATACTATISLTGGASNERVVIKLPDPGMRLTSVKPDRKKLDGAYLVSDQRSRAGGTTYAFTLNAAEAGKGAVLRFRFERPGKASPKIVRCNGGPSRCHARIPLGGGASNRRFVVQLPATDLSLASVKPSSKKLRGAYSPSRQRLRRGASERAFTLSAVESTPHGSHLTMRVCARPRLTACE